MCAIDPVKGVGNPIRWNVIEGILKVVVWEGNRKWEGENDKVEDMIVCSLIMVHTSMHLTRSNPTEMATHGLPLLPIWIFSLYLTTFPVFREGEKEQEWGIWVGMQIVLAIGSDRTHINDFFEGGSLGKVMEDDQRWWRGQWSVSMSLYYGLHQLISFATTWVDPVEAMTHRLPIFASLPTLHNQVNDTGKVSNPLSWLQNSILTPLILQEHLPGVFYPIDHEPTISLVMSWFQTISGSYILPLPRSNIKGMFAAGDVRAQNLYGTAEYRMYKVQWGWWSLHILYHFTMQELNLIVSGLSMSSVAHLLSCLSVPKPKPTQAATYYQNEAGERKQHVWCGWCEGQEVWANGVWQVERPMAEDEEFLKDKKQSKYDKIFLVKPICVDAIGDILGRSTCQPCVLI